MREIKFRAWDSYLKKMVFEGFHIWGEVTEFDLIKQHCDQNPNPAYEHSLLRANDMVFMQYTGLKDKNGKEIYEGDIVNNKELDWEVFWNDAVAGYEFASLPNNTNNRISWMPNFDAVAYEFEVIGNIYENPELLKGE